MFFSLSRRVVLLYIWHRHVCDRKVPFFQKRGINQCAISIHNAAACYHNEIVVVEALFFQGHVHAHITLVIFSQTDYMSVTLFQIHDEGAVFLIDFHNGF